MAHFKVFRYRLVECDDIPEVIREDCFYYSRKEARSVHLCPCGCGGRVELPIYFEGEPEDRGGYHLHNTDDGLFTLVEPICNHKFSCCSMYYIRSAMPEPHY